MMSVDTQPQSRSQDAGFLGRANEGELGSGAIHFPIDRAETGSSSSGKGLASFCGPRAHKVRYSIARVADASEMIGIDHQLYWLVPHIAAHFVFSGVLTAEEIRSRPTRSAVFRHETKVGGASATKGPAASSMLHAGRSATSTLADERGRDRSLSAYTERSGRNATASGWGLDHPRLDCRLLHQDALLIPDARMASRATSSGLCPSWAM